MVYLILTQRELDVFNCAISSSPHGYISALSVTEGLKWIGHVLKLYARNFELLIIRSFCFMQWQVLLYWDINKEVGRFHFKFVKAFCKILISVRTCNLCHITTTN